MALWALTTLLSWVGTTSACTDLATPPTSRWTVASHRGVAWLRTPCGASFFSLGINTLDAGNPPDGGGRLPYYWALSHSDFSAWLAATRARVAAWGFNTAGASSLPPALLALPVVPNLALGQSARFHWVDPFDPASEKRLRETARRLVAPYRGSPYRIGYFPDNEVGWWSGALFAFYLEEAETNHTKRHLVALLRQHYRDDWRRFARDFIPPAGVRSFDELLRRRGATAYLRPGGAGIQIVRRWTGMVAGRYYRLIARALHKADPEALVFSDRLPIYYDPAAVRAMVPYVDVIATNYNVDSSDGWIARYYFDGLRRLSGGKPVLVSEWFFASDENRTGNLNNGHLMAVASQMERARGAGAAAEAFAREPSIVGVHWFQYYDHPRGGRGDGEDYNFGLVDVQDRPYEELVGVFSRLNPRLAAIHTRARPPATAPYALPHATIDARDGSLADWPKARALLPAMKVPPSEVPFADLYLAWDEGGLSLALIGMDYYSPELIPPGAELPPSETFHVDWGVDAGRGRRRFALRIVPSLARGDGYEMRAELCGVTADGCTPVPGAVAAYFGADQPRITAEIRLPWRALGIDGAPPRALRTELGVTAFHRARWMSSSGRAPAVAMRNPAGWRTVPLASAAAVPESLPVRDLLRRSASADAEGTPRTPHRN